MIEALAARLAVDATPIASLAAELGVSDRHLRRRCHERLGYGPKTFARIVRFQSFRALAEGDEDDGLAALALRAGYADQPHLTRGCRRLSGETPQAFVSRLRSASAA